MNHTESIVVEKSRLEGEVWVSGAKNSALRLLAASLLTAEPIKLTNYPDSILDAVVHVEMLECLGKRCSVKAGEITITEVDAPLQRLDYKGRSIRNTLLILGALTARTGAGAVPLPGGCKLGDRKYDLHVKLLEDLGASVWEEDGYLCASAPKGGLVGTDIRLALRSTGATENAILCGSLAKGITRIWNPHIRPEILDLIAFLRKLGVQIGVRGQESIIVHGQEGLSGAEHEVIPDNMEALTWLIGSVMTQGDVEIIGFSFDHLEIPLIHLRESGARFYRFEDRLIVRGGQCYPIDISTGPYPGINSDMQPLFAVYSALANGESRITDLRFPGRYAYAAELAKMGVDYRIDKEMLIINGDGPTSLHAADVTAGDLRAGAALTLAGLTANGQTKVNAFWQAERGYDRLFEKIQALGGKIAYA